MPRRVAAYAVADPTPPAPMMPSLVVDFALFMSCPVLGSLVCLMCGQRHGVSSKAPVIYYALFLRVYVGLVALFTIFYVSFY